RRDNRQELITALHRVVDNGEGRLEPEQTVAVQRELARLYTSTGEDTFAAIDAWNRLLEVDPADVEAIDELDKAYRVEHQWEGVVRDKMLRAVAFDVVDARIAELLEVATLWETELERADGAKVALAQILEIEPLHDEAFEQLQKLHKAAGRWEELIELYLA